MNPSPLDPVEFKKIQDQILPICSACSSAVVVCVDLYLLGRKEQYDYIDILTQLDIRGEDIWLTYQNKCDRDVGQMASYLKNKIKDQI